MRVFTGGSGLLGTNIKHYFLGDMFPDSASLNICDYGDIFGYFNNLETQDIKVTEVVHMAAYTDTAGIEKHQPSLCNAIDANIIGTANLAYYCLENNLKLTYISSDYVFKGDKGDYVEDDELSPVNLYGWSKLGGECSVRMLPSHLIIRTSFCEEKFTYDNAFSDQYTTRVPVSKAAEYLADTIKKDIQGVVHVGGEKKTVLELARELSPEKTIGEITTDQYHNATGYRVPKDTSLSTNRKD